MSLTPATAMASDAVAKANEKDTIHIINTIMDSCEPTLKQIAELKKQTNEPTLLKQLENTENELLVQAVLYIRNPETLTRKK